MTRPAVPRCPARFPSPAAVAPRLGNASATKSRGTERRVADLADGEARRHIAAKVRAKERRDPEGMQKTSRRRGMCF